MHLAFVHLGAAPAPHLWLNIKRIKALFPELPITLIYSDVSFIERDLIQDIYYFQYLENLDPDSPLNNLAHNTTFRGGFWKYSLERLFALAEWHAHNPKEALIHLESDILVMPNFPFMEISKIKKLSWCKFSDSHDVASIVYSPNVTETLWLASQLKALLALDNSLTDMTALRKIKQTFPQKILYLNYDSSEVDFAGIFDAAPFGMWLCGRDPRNHWGFIRRFLDLPESDVQATDRKFYFSKDLILSVSDKEYRKVPLYNLHVHSKITRLFSLKWAVFIRFLVMTSRIKFPSFWFSPTAFSRILKDYRKRHQDMNLFRLCLKALSYK